MQFPLRQLPIIVLILMGVALSGCQSDPYCQQAISNLRSEKIQLENQYFALKNQYETDMLRLGQPLPGSVPQSSPGGILDQFAPSTATEISSVPHQPSIDRQVTGNGLKQPAVADVSDYIKSVDVSQLQAQSGESVRLLIQPLDDRGDVIPVAGDLKVTLLDSRTGSSLASYQFDRQQVEAMVEDRNGQVSGIHLGLPTLTNSQSSQNMICQIRFRTAGHQVLSSQTPVVLAGGSPGRTATNQSAPIRSMTRPGVSELSDTPPLNDVTVEIGDELNLDSLSNGSSSGPTRPSWTPGR